MGEIIYEKHFHKETIEEIEKERIDFVEAFGEYAKRHHGRIRGVVDYEHWDAHIDLYLRMLEFDDAEDTLSCRNARKWRKPSSKQP